MDAIVTDPPYGIAYQSAWRTDRAAWLPKIANDEAPFVDWLPEGYRVLKDGGALICFCAWKTQEDFRLAIQDAGFEIKSHVIWDRDSHGMGHLEGEFAPQHDVIWFATKGSFTFPGKRPKSVLRHLRVQPKALRHPNEKPIRLMIDLIQATCPRDGLVLEPFAGSGSTLEACMKSGRRCLGIELDERYIPVIKRRCREAETPLFDNAHAGH